MGALIAGAGLSLLRTVSVGEEALLPENVNWLGIVLFAAAFFVLRKWKWNPILVMLLCGIANLGIHVISGSV